MAKRTITLDLLAKNNTSKGFRDAERDADGFGRGLSKIGAGIGLAFAAGAAVMIKAGFEAVEALKRLEVIGAQTEAAIKSTGGAANVTAEQVRELADSLERATATESEAIQEGANLLLTFTNIRNGANKNERVFDRATELMVDMARAMGTDAAGSAIQLGKALNDPISGIAALTRVGVQFTDEQKDLIRSLQESGDMFGAQQVILNELETQFGGSGEAYAATLSGQIDTLNHNMGGLAEEVMLSLLPALQEFVEWGNSELVPYLGELADWFVADGVPAIKDFVGWVVEFKDELVILTAVIGTAVAAQWLLNAAAAANPWGAVIAALIAVGGWTTWVITNFSTAQNWMLTAADSTLIFLARIAMGINSIVTGFINGVISMINVMREPLNAVLRLLNLPEMRIPQLMVSNSGLQGIINQSLGNIASRNASGIAGGGGVGPGMRAMAAGGIVSATPGGIPAVIGEGLYDEAVIPLSPRNVAAMSGGGDVHIHLSGVYAGDKDALARTIVQTIRDARRRGGIGDVSFA